MKMPGRWILSVLLLTLWALPAAAQEPVEIRIGDHARYSRLVFDLTDRAEYELDTSDQGRLSIRFKKPLAVQSRPAGDEAAKNLAGFDVLSQSPLSVEADIPRDSRVRHFYAGNRLVVDIYNSPSGITIGAGVSPTPKAAAATNDQRAAINPPTKPEIVPQTSPASEETQARPPRAVPVRDVQEVKAEPPEVAENEPMSELERLAQEAKNAVQITEGEQEAPAEEPTVLSISAINGFDLAAFMLNGKLWALTGQDDILTSAQITGPRKDEISPFTEKKLEGAKIFEAPAPDMYRINADGGGLVWRLAYSRGAENPFKNGHVRPMREEVDDRRERSGKVIWPLEQISKIMDITHPYTGETIKVVTVNDASQYAGPAYDFVDFYTLPSPLGLAIVSKVDDLSVEQTPRGIEVSRPGGLSVISQREADLALRKKELFSERNEAGQDIPRIYNFQSWQMGGLDVLEENKNIILSELNDMPESRRGEEILTLAKMYLSNTFGPEAVGFLKMASENVPGLEENPEYIALLGAAEALNGQYEEAFQHLSIPELKPYPEIGYWRSYVLASLGDWKQAAEVLPGDFDVLYFYPDKLFNTLAIVLSEVLLRAGEVDRAEELLGEIDRREGPSRTYLEAALPYLKGEAQRQRGNLDATKILWGPLIDGKDDLYRTKAGLAYTRLLVNEGEIAGTKAIDNLERLRYAWRGDELEAQVNFWLGRTYFENNEFVKGLNIMRDAAALVADTGFGQEIAAEMSDVFTTLFLGPQLERISPLDAVTLYEQFSELVPTGERGNRVIEKLAEHLVRADLLGRAATLLSGQVDHRLEGFEAYRIAVRLAAIQLLDNKPKEAIATIGKAETKFKELSESLQTPERARELILLRARALADQDRPDLALDLMYDLEKTPAINNLKADIAWHAAYWDDAADALHDMILDKNISLTRPLDSEETELIIRRAVALNLASDRIGLANLREKYSDIMAQTEKAKAFEVITRPRQSASLADRETLMNIVSEVELFGDFLESYREGPSATVN